MASVGFARAYVENLRVGRIDRDVADAHHRLVVEDGVPRLAGIGRFEHAARRSRCIDERWIDRIKLDIRDPPADVGRPDRLPGAERGGLGSGAQFLDLDEGPAVDVGIGGEVRESPLDPTVFGRIPTRFVERRHIVRCSRLLRRGIPPGAEDQAHHKKN